ncbi:unnamed protein product [Paramecium primaurelia]|uniref:Phospholipid scramblase n=1 Tax=Paramecium primaurelia TaxID=5886 RepID=A0A8S1QJ47_PARPR|nr:unnamed protein product [Paramecium primaurelia]
MYVPLNVSNDMSQPNFYQMNDYKQISNQPSSLHIIKSLTGIQMQEQYNSSTFNQGSQNSRILNLYATNFCGQLISQIPLFQCVSNPQSSTISSGQLKSLLLFVQKIEQPNSQQMPNSLNQNGLFLRLERKWQFSFLCFNRPRLNVFYVEKGQNKLLGYVEVPYTFITKSCYIFDGNNNFKYKITKRLLGQSKTYSPFPESNRYDLDYFDTKDSQDQVISQMRKQPKSEYYFDQQANFTIVFPEISSAEGKVLILAAALIFECMYI